MIPTSSIAEIKTINDVHTPRTPAASPNGMKWQETTKNAKMQISPNNLIQQAGRADPDPPTEEESDGEPPRRHQAREDTVQEEGKHPLSKHLQPSRENSEGDDNQTSPKRLKKIKLEKQGGRTQERTRSRTHTPARRG